MLPSHIIDVGGVFIGAAVRIDRGYRFVATGCRMDEPDASTWPSLTDVPRAARRVHRDAMSAGPVSPSLHSGATRIAVGER